VSGDINGDGLADLVLGNATPDEIRPSVPGDWTNAHVFLGALSRPLSTRSDGEPFSSAFPIATQDVNGDGFDDLVWLGTSSIILFGGADGIRADRAVRFSISLRVGESAAINALRLGDLDGDGYGDVFGYGGVLYGQADWSRTPRWSPGTLGGIMGQAADVNLDGVDDLVTSWRTTESHSFRGRLVEVRAHTDVPIDMGRGRALERTVGRAGDLDGDGRPEVIATVFCEPPVMGQICDPETLRIYNATPEGLVENRSERLAAGFFSHGFSPGDLDADGYDDLVIVRQSTSPTEGGMLTIRGGPPGRRREVVHPIHPPYRPWYFNGPVSF
jgi:hypothetical protein